jgi:hypothetical protein
MSFWKVPPYVIDLEVYEETVTVAQMTDATTTGTYTCTFELPVGFWIHRAILTDVTGFAGDTSATINVGLSGDNDRLNTGNPSVFASATIIDLGAPSGILPVTTAFKPVIIVTSATDFTSVVTDGNGRLTLKVMGYRVR